MLIPMSSNTLRTGKRVYGSSGTTSPNYKGATAVRPGEALKGTNKDKSAGIVRAARKRLGY